MIDRHGSVFIKPVFKGGVGKKGKAGLIGRATDLKTALAEKERLYFVEHRLGNHNGQGQRRRPSKAACPAEHEVYFSITDSTRFRAPTMTLTHMGGVDIEELDKDQLAQVPFDPLTGLKAFVVANALSRPEGAAGDHLAAGAAPAEAVGAVPQLRHDHAGTEPDPHAPGRDGRLTPVACDFKCGFDRDDPRWSRLDLPPHLFSVDYSDFEPEINQLRTHQGQSDVYVINPARHHPRAHLRRRRQFAGHGDARRRGDHLVGFRRQPALREDEGSGTHLLQALAGAGECAVHHRRQVEQHRYLRNLPRHGRRVARTFQPHAADAAVRRARPRRAEPGARHGRAARYAAKRSACPTDFRLRFRHQRGDLTTRGGGCG